jgi:uncharacterized coiled-coil protein SlyX
MRLRMKPASQDASMLAASAGDSDAAAYIAGLEADVRKLGRRCLAREQAIESLSSAVMALRRANRALSEELSVLRLEIERLRAYEPNAAADVPQVA